MTDLPAYVPMTECPQCKAPIPPHDPVAHRPECTWPLPPDAPAAGPMWTNGVAPDPFTAAAAATCPTWCAGDCHTDPWGQRVHELVVHTDAVLDEALETDVPLRVVLRRYDDGAGQGRPVTHLEIGHALYQPTGIALDRKQRALLAAALLTCTHLEGM